MIYTTNIKLDLLKLAIKEEIEMKNIGIMKYFLGIEPQ